ATRRTCSTGTNSLRACDQHSISCTRSSVTTGTRSPAAARLSFTPGSAVLRCATTACTSSTTSPAAATTSTANYLSPATASPRCAPSHSETPPIAERQTGPTTTDTRTAGEGTDTMTTMTAEDQQATADPVDVDDLAATDDAPIVPELDPEAALLCALLHTTDTGEARHIADHLTPADYLNSRYAELHEAITT